MSDKARTTSLEWVANNLPAFAKAEYANNPRAYFESFVKDLVNFGVPNVQNNRNRHAKVDENALTDLLLSPLQAGYTLSQETNANGHVDVTLKGFFPGIMWKGEAKILKSYRWYESGLVKLVAKYNSGGEDNTFMIGFCRDPDMFSIAKEYKARLQHRKPADFQNWSRLSSFDHPNIFTGEHLASGRPILVTHIWSNCHYETDKKVLAAKSKGTVKNAKKPPAKPRQTLAVKPNGTAKTAKQPAAKPKQMLAMKPKASANNAKQPAAKRKKR